MARAVLPSRPQRPTARRAAVAVLLLLAAACGRAPDAATLDAAAAATRELGTVSVRLEGAAFSQPSRPLGSFAAQGIADLVTGDRRTSVEVDIAGTEPYVVDVVVVDDVVHHQGLPGISGDAPVVVTGAPRAISADLATFVDPSALLSLVEDLRGAVIDRGREDVGGVGTQRLGVRLPDARVGRSIGEIIDGLGEDMAAAVAEAGDVRASATADVWIDEDGLIRRLEVRTVASVGPGGSIPGIGAVDNVVLLELTPSPEAGAIEPPLGASGFVEFATLIGVGDDVGAGPPSAQRVHPS